MGVGVLTNRENVFDVKQTLRKGFRTDIQKISADGAIDATVPVVQIEATKIGMAVTLPDGKETDRILLVQVSEVAGTDTVIVTPANLGNHGDAAVTTITFDAVGELCELIFVNGAWYVVALEGATVA